MSRYDRNAKPLFFISIVLCIALAAGCGGGKKKTSAAAPGSPEGTLSGKVIPFTGFGLDAGRGEVMETLKGGDILVRLYRIQTGGAGLSPVSETQAKPLSGNSFKLEKVPLSENNLIVRLEKSEGEPVLAAIVPPVKMSGGFVVISPETDLEAAVLLKLLEGGIREPGDLRPAALDAVFIKDMVTPGLFFDMDQPPEKDAAVAALTPAIRDGYLRFVDTLLGEGADPSGDGMVTLMSHILEPMMAAAVSEDSRKLTGAGGNADLQEALAQALAELDPAAEMLSPETIWWLAWTKSRLSAARCLASPGVGTCPKLQDGAADLSSYGRSLGDDLGRRIWNREVASRVDELFPGASATGTARLQPVDSIEKLLNLPGAVVEPFRAAARSEVSGPDFQPLKLKHVLADFRDTLVTGALGLSFADADKIYSSLQKEGQTLALAASDPAMNIKQVGNAHQKFISAQKTIFQPICSAARSRYTRLEETDTSKICRAISDIILYATVYDVPSGMFYTRDTDEDLVPDNVEAELGTEAADKDSSPAEVLTATPASMLPPSPPDADGDGWFDSVEAVAGTDPENPASKPVPGEINFCKKAGAICPLAAVETDNSVFKITGYVSYEANLLRGVTAALYEDPDFINGRLVSISDSPTKADGEFTLEAPAGRGYFIGAFTDLDGSGGPNAGEAVGYLGDKYPRRFTPDRDGRIEIPLEMIGIIGAAKCENGKFHDPVSAECVENCPDGFEADTLTGTCACGRRLKYIEPAGTCDQECPPGTVDDPVRGGCYCPKGTILDREHGECRCPEGMVLDKSAGQCRCEKGFLQPWNMQCVERCPDTYVADSDIGSCECPDNAQRNSATGGCECKSGSYDPVNVACVSFCPYGMEPGPATGICACPENEVFEAAKEECVCVPGMERTAQGNCADPAAQPAPRDDRRPPHEREGRPEDGERPVPPHEAGTAPAPETTPDTGDRKGATLQELMDKVGDLKDGATVTEDIPASTGTVFFETED